MDWRSITTGAALSYGGAVATLAIGFILKVVVARALSPSDLGLLFTALVIVGLAQTLAEMGLPEAVARFVAFHAPDSMARAKGVLVVGLRISLAATVVVVLVLAAGAGFVANVMYAEPALSGVLVLLALPLPLVALTDALAAASRGAGQIWVKVLCADVARLVWVLLAVSALLLFGLNTLLAVAATYSTAALAAAVLTVVAFRRDPRWAVKGEPSSSRALLDYALPLLGTGIVAWPSTLIPLYLGSLVSVTIVTYFNLSLALSSLIYLLVSAVDIALLPAMAAYAARGDMPSLARLYASTTRWCYVASSIVFAPLFLLPTAPLTAFYGSAYAEGAPILQWAAVVTLANAITGTNGSVVRALGATRLFLLAIATGGLAELLGAYPLIANWGLPGGLVILTVGQFLNVGLFSFLLWRRFGIHAVTPAYVKTLAVSAGALALAALARPSLGDGVAGAGILTAIYATTLLAGLAVTRAFDETDVAVLARCSGLLSRLRP